MKPPLKIQVVEHPKRKPTLLAAGLQRGTLRLKFDATAFYPHYKDIVWAKDVQSEKLCICELALKGYY